MNATNDNQNSTKRNDCFAELKNVKVDERDNLMVHIPRINVFDIPTFEAYQRLTNDLREQVSSLSQENKEENKFLNINGNSVRQSLLSDVVQHLMGSPTFLHDGVIGVWDDAATAYWNSLEPNEREAVPVLFAILWAQGRIELFCTCLAKEAAQILINQ